MLLVIASMLGLAFGASSVGFADVWRSITHHVLSTTTQPNHESINTILWDLRAPRVVLGALIGALLSIAGATYQSVFRNPLADPYLLGAAAGAGLGATIGFVTGVTALVAPLAFLGALAAVLAAWSLGSVVGGTRDVALVLLSGIAVMSLLTAVQTFILQRNSQSLNAVYAWILGTVSTAGWSDVLRILPAFAISIVVVWWLGHRLDVLALGDEKARTLGLRVPAVRFVALGAATLATATAVSVSGLIGFVGLVIPHIARRLAGPSMRGLVVVSALLGAGFVVLADLGARTLTSPGEVPLGVITAFLGSPFFLLILRATRHQRVSL